MELRTLRYFLAICQDKNISKAANVLHISQPSLSRQLKNLETELGVQLIQRGHHQITLTPQGYYLYERAKELIGLADKTTYNLQKTNIINGELYIGAGESPALKRIMKVIDTIMQENHEIKVHFYSGNADDIEAKVNSGLIDFGIAMGDRKLENFESIILPERNEFGVIMSVDDPLAQLTKIKPSDLLNKPLIVSSQSLVQDKFRNWWGNYYDQIQIAATTNLAYNASLLVQQKHTYLITYKKLVDQQKGLCFRPLSPRVTDPNIIIWKPNTHLSNVAQLFIQRLQNSLNIKDF